MKQMHEAKRHMELNQLISISIALAHCYVDIYINLIFNWFALYFNESEIGQSTYIDALAVR